MLITAADLPGQAHNLPESLRSPWRWAPAVENALVSVHQGLHSLPGVAWIGRNFALEFNWVTFAPTPLLNTNYVTFVAIDGDQRRILWSSRPDQPFTVYRWVDPLEKIKGLLSAPGRTPLLLGFCDYLLERYQQVYRHRPDAISVEIDHQSVSLQGPPLPPQHFQTQLFKVNKP